MSDQLTVPPTPESVGRPRPHPRFPVRTALLQGLVTVLLMALAGAVGGWLLHRLWDPPLGLVYEGGWYRGLTSVDPPTFDVTADYEVFSGVAWFTLVALGAGLLGGLVTALWLSRSELVALAAVAIGGLAGGWLMRTVALRLAPDSPGTPDGAASWAAEGARLPDTLHLSPWLVLALPAAGLLVLALVYLLLPGRSATDVTEED